jgi:hypothetical protein
MNKDDKEDHTIYKAVVNPSAAEPQPKVGITRAKAQRPRCHFDRREKSFSDPSHLLGMTGVAPSLGVLGVLAGENGLRKKMEKQEDK